MLPPPSSAAGLLKKFPDIIYFDNWSPIFIIETRTGKLILSPIFDQSPFFRNRILMYVFHFLDKKLFGENILCLQILPNAVVLSSVATLSMEKRKKLLTIIITQLVEDGMGRE